MQAQRLSPEVVVRSHGQWKLACSPWLLLTAALRTVLVGSLLLQTHGMLFFWLAGSCPGKKVVCSPNDVLICAWVWVRYS